LKITLTECLSGLSEQSKNYIKESQRLAGSFG
jgi:hypothetical protein